MSINNPLELAMALEKKHNIPLWRKSFVIPADLSKSGKKEYKFEYPKKTSKDIKNGWKSSSGKEIIPGRGYDELPSWVKDCDGAYLGCSIYLKFIKDLFVIDFDTKEKCNIDTNPFFRFCMEQNTITHQSFLVLPKLVKMKLLWEKLIL
jgi:hypothetical protein